MKLSALRKYRSEIRSKLPFFIRKTLVLTLLVGLFQSITPAQHASAATSTTAANGTTVTNTYTDTTKVETFTVPANVTSLTLTVKGAQGAQGGTDYGTPPPVASYIGNVTGTIAVTPGQVLSIGVGKGATNASGMGCTWWPYGFVNSDLYYRYAYVSVGGTNPLKLEMLVAPVVAAAAGLQQL